MSATKFVSGVLATIAGEADVFARHITGWANPDMKYEDRLTKNWPMVRLDHAAFALAAYTVIVIVGLLRKPRGWKPSAEPKQKANWLDNFKNEPIRIFQAFYNLTQVCVPVCGCPPWPTISLLLWLHARTYACFYMTSRDPVCFSLLI